MYYPVIDLAQRVVWTSCSEYVCDYRIVATINGNTIVAIKEIYEDAEYSRKSTIYVAYVNGMRLLHRDAYNVLKEIKQVHPIYEDTFCGFGPTDPDDMCYYQAMDNCFENVVMLAHRENPQLARSIIADIKRVISLNALQTWDEHAFYEPGDIYESVIRIKLHKDFVYSGKSELTIDAAIALTK